ncbi:unnamed protein product [Parascedosporium putredinis]|uniref:Heterokaryon incompatibility domain-containing protein n=1 Tax=Parascedosporium putredinis TaxID=1442378 RepID=A0A9P1H1X6_9PEZI|nr:unnamed protein product [Parascedosporium putredinis]CAI7994222.1 unnamed protein product [Parascedosporium putredinis]
MQAIEKCGHSASTLPETMVRLDIDVEGFPSFDVTHPSSDTKRLRYSASPLLDEIPIGYNIPDATYSDESFLWIQQQLVNCDSTHATCATSTPNPLPNRILDVGTSGADATIRVRTTNREPARYICLSHCWGPDQPPLRTLTGNLADHERCVPEEALPKTFREAVALTRKLGIRYLWIDSLIYAGAYLTVAAAHARMSLQGLYSAREPQYEETPLDVSVLPGAGDAVEEARGYRGTIYARHAIRHIGRHTHPYDIRRGQRNTPLPLLSRAWVLQERFLSRRVLFFTGQELAWECIQRMGCQCRGHSESIAPSNNGENGGNATSSISVFKRLAAMGLTSAIHDRATATRAWSSIVRDYTALYLTFEKDVFPALSGIARQMSHLTGSRYVAGLWEDSLLSGLCWHVDGRSSRPSEMLLEPRPSVWRAPTWSWAAIKSPVVFVGARVDSYVPGR